MEQTVKLTTPFGTFASYLLPMVVIYLFAQQWVINGVTQGAVK